MYAVMLMKTKILFCCDAGRFQYTIPLYILQNSFARQVWQFDCSDKIFANSSLFIFIFPQTHYILPETFRRGGRQADSGVFCNTGGMVCHGNLARCKLEFHCVGAVKCRSHSAFTGMSSAL